MIFLPGVIVAFDNELATGPAARIVAPLPAARNSGVPSPPCQPNTFPAALFRFHDGAAKRRTKSPSRVEAEQVQS